MPALVIGIPAAVALKWARGELEDADIAKTPHKPEIVMAWGLESRFDLPDGLRDGLALHRAGAVAFTTRTSHPVMLRYYLKRGAVVTFRAGESVRLLIPPDKFLAWITKLEKHSKMPPPRPA